MSKIIIEYCKVPNWMILLILLMLFPNNILVMNLVLLLLQQKLQKRDDVMDKLFNHFPKPKVYFSDLIISPASIPLRGNYDALMRRGGVPEEEMMRYESLRLGSFAEITLINWPHRLATAGFYATGDGDETRCFSCGVRHRDWGKWEKPDSHHKGDCKHRRREDPRNVPLFHTPIPALPRYPRNDIDMNPQGDNSNRSINSTRAPNCSHANTTAVQSFDNAVYPTYSDQQRRLTSFLTWPEGHCKTPADLVECGFFYAGYADCVRCFVCGVGLRTWETEDEPWVEHARWRSSCDYVKAIKGAEFIMQVLGEGSPQNDPNDSEQDEKNHMQKKDNNAASKVLQELKEENVSLKHDSTCKICLDNPSCIVFLPCGHLVTCAECAPALRKCPICRAIIRGTVRTFSN